MVVKELFPRLQVYEVIPEDLSHSESTLDITTDHHLHKYEGGKLVGHGFMEEIIKRKYRKTRDESCLKTTRSSFLVC